MPYDIPRVSGYRIQPFKLQDDEALVASLANQLLKARLAEARAAARGGGGGGGGKGREKKEKGEWVMKYNPETKRYDKVWVAGGTGEERKINMKGEDYNKTADWVDANPEAQRLLGVLRNGSASNKAKQQALSEFRALKGADALSGMSPEAVDEVIERQAKPYKEQVETEKKEIAESGSGLLTNIRIGAERLGTFISTIGDDAETTLEKRRKSLERQQEIRESDPYTREQMRREAEGESLWDRSDGPTGVAANAAGYLLSDPSALPVVGGALAGGLVGGIPGAVAGASIAAAGGAAAGDTYLGERLVQDDRLSEAERVRAYEEGKLSEMGVNAAVNAIPFGGGAVTRAGRTALAAAGRTALGEKAAGLATDFARNSAWRTAEATAPYAERFGGLAGDAAEQAVAKAAMRPIAADLVRQSERGVAGALKYDILPEAAMASGLNAAAMAGSNAHYNALTGQDDSVLQNVPEAAAMGLLFGIPYGVGSALGARRRAIAGETPEIRLAKDQQKLDELAKVESSRSYNEAYGISDEAPAEGKAGKKAEAEAGKKAEAKAGAAASVRPAEAAGPSSEEAGQAEFARNVEEMVASSPSAAERGPANMPGTPKAFVDLFRKDASSAEILETLGKKGFTPDGVKKWMRETFPDAMQTNEAGFRDLYDKIPSADWMDNFGPGRNSQGSASNTVNDFNPNGRSPASPEAVRPQAERNPASGRTVAFSDAERAKLASLHEARPEWSNDVQNGWWLDPAYRAAAEEFVAADRAYRYAGQNVADVRPAKTRLNEAYARYRNVVDQLALRDADLLLNPDRAAYGAGRGRKPEVRNGEGTVPGAGAGASVRGAGLEGEGRTGQTDTGTGRPLGTDTKSPAGANANRVPTEAGGGNPAYPGGGPSGRTRRSASKTQDPAGRAADAGDGLVSDGEGSFRERGAGTTAEVRADADTLARRTGHPEEPSAGSDSLGDGSEAALTPPSRGAEFELRNELGRVGNAKFTNDGIAKGAEKLAKMGLGREEVARFMDVFARHENPLFTTALERDAMFDPSLRRELGIVPASDKHFTDAMKKGIMRLADYYGIPPVTERALNDFNPGFYGWHLASALNGRFAELRSAGIRLTDNAFGEFNALRSHPIGSGEWLDAAAGVLNRALGEMDASLERDAGSAMGARFFKDNFPDRWRAAELGSKPKPIEVADIADRLDHRDTLGETAERQRNGDQHC